MPFTRICAVINDENGLHFSNMKSGHATFNGKTYFYDRTKAYKINGVEVCFFNDGKATNFKHKNLIKVNKKSMKTKIRELFGRIEVGNQDGI